jgi:hypothetical protein
MAFALVGGYQQIPFQNEKNKDFVGVGLLVWFAENSL